jgi:glucose/arabinose dehydrogenase
VVELSNRHCLLIICGLAIAFAGQLRDSRAASFHVERLATGFHLPVYAATAPGDDDRIFVVQLGGLASDETDGDPNTSVFGKIMIYNRATNTVNSQPFLVVNDTSAVDPVVQEPEVGLWALAFHPDYQNNGRLFINVAVDTPAEGPFSSMIREHAVSANPDIANQAPTKLVMQVDQPEFNHNGSWMGFNPISNAPNDNTQYLYITLGDGGGQFDPRGNGQDRTDVFGSVLRIDVDSPPDPGLNYHIPESNPYHGHATFAEEIWNYGLRNPWQASFDRDTGDFWIGDVGQNNREEIDFQPASSTGGENYGWGLREGTIATPNIGGPPPDGNVEPVYDYPHLGQGPAGFTGNSVAGGRVYRGPVEELQGFYIFADSHSGEMWSFDPVDPYGTIERLNLNPAFTPDVGTIDFVASFGEDNQGNLLIVDYLGDIFQVVPNFPVTVTVDRQSGEMSFSNDTGEITGVRGYTLSSAAGAIDRDNLTPITGRLDAEPNGDGTIDLNNFWEITSAVGDHHQFTEASTGGAASLAADGGFMLSPGDGWIQSIYEDLNLSVVLSDGTVEPAVVRFVGAQGTPFENPFERSDLNFNGMIDPGDWPIFRDNHLTELSELSAAQSYQLGDLDGDGDNDFADFRLFQSDYIDSLGAAAFARLFAVPEPSSAVLVAAVLVVLPLCSRGRRRAGCSHGKPIGRCSVRTLLVASAATGVIVATTSTVKADLVHQYTFNDANANDLAGSAHGMVSGNVTFNLGAADLPGADDDYINLPASMIDIDSYTDASFEAWFSYRGGGPWQRVFDFGRTLQFGGSAGEGRDYVFYTPNSGDGDNRAAITDAGGGAPEDRAIGDGILALDQMYHLVVVVDDDVNGGTGQLLVYLDGELEASTNLTNSISDVSDELAYLGNSVWVFDDSLNGRIEEFRIYDHALSLQDVIESRDAGFVPFATLGLEVNTVTGSVDVVNGHTDPLSFDYYRVTSASGALDTSATGWLSLSDQDVDTMGPEEGESWDEIGEPDDNQLAELYLLGASPATPGTPMSLGHMYNPAVFGQGVEPPENELQLQFALQDDDLRTGTVTYVTPGPMDGDYNQNGVVDAADYTVWRDALGTSLATADGDGDGVVDRDDYVIWQWTFGNVAGDVSASVAAVVPEPTSGSMIAVVCVGLLVSRRRRTPA